MKLFFLIISLGLGVIAQAQEGTLTNPRTALEVDVINYDHLYFNPLFLNGHNKFNYGVSVLDSAKVKRVKFSQGLSY